MDGEAKKKTEIVKLKTLQVPFMKFIQMSK